MNYRELKSFTILGIGGKGAYFVAKYLLLSGREVIGYDLKRSERTEELENLGASITYSNPDLNERFGTDGYIFSNDLPQKIQKPIHDVNKELPNLEVGQLYHKILEDYEEKNLSEIELEAFKVSNIAPLYSIPKSDMKFIGVTGTDGKTTTCTMIYHILKECGFKPALITTVSAKIGDEEIDTGFHTTTPTSQELYSLISKAIDAECTHMVLETTSHALLQGRVMGIKFDGVGYTNITEEHLDYHKSWESLAEAKSMLIRNHTKESSVIVLNRDDARSFGYLKDFRPYEDYSILEKANIFAKDIVESEEALSFDLCKGNYCYDCNIPILGNYNVSNFLLAASIVNGLEGIVLEDIVKSISNFSTIEGRMEVVQAKPFMIIVDYAHTPNAIENALKSTRKLTDGRIIHVFGSAGQRDFYKRPVMGKLSNMYADVTVLTAEDSRLESLKEINDEIETGWHEGGNSDAQLIRFDNDKEDVKVRRDAITKALEIAKDGDVVIITGKAHETTLCFGQEEYPWNDIDEVKKLIS